MIDYDGILTEGLKLLWRIDREEIALEELLCDEIQDSAAIDWDIIDAIPAATKVVVGDDLQSMYGFRGARPELFVERAQSGTFFTLEHNYRSDRLICQAANALIAHNEGQLPKRIRPTSPADGVIEVFPEDHSREEAGRCQKILKGWRVDGIAWQEMAVLARTNAIVDEIRAGLRQMGVPVAQDRRQQLPGDWALCVVALQLMQDPANNVLCEQFLKGKMVPAAVVNTLKMSALKSGVAMSVLAEAAALAVPRATKTDTIPVALAKLGIGQESIALVHERLLSIPMKDPKLSDLLADVYDQESWEEEDAVPGVTVCTAHKAKGKEFDAVIVAGLEEGVMPSLSKSSDLAEERRICFVCVTRARHRLALVWCAQRFQYGKNSEQAPSRFIEEMGVFNGQFP